MGELSPNRAGGGNLPSSPSSLTEFKEILPKYKDPDSGRSLGVSPSQYAPARFSPDSCAQGRERTAVRGRRAAGDQEARVHPGSARSLGDRDPAASEPARSPPPRPPRSIYGAALGPGIARRSRGGGGVVNLASGGEVAGEGPAAGGSGATRRASLQLQAGRAARKCGAGASPPPRPPRGLVSPGKACRSAFETPCKRIESQTSPQTGRGQPPALCSPRPAWQTFP